MNSVVKGFDKTTLFTSISLFNRQTDTIKRKNIIKLLEKFEAIIWLQFKNKTLITRKIFLLQSWIDILKCYGKASNIIKCILPVFISENFSILIVDSSITIRQNNVIKTMNEIEDKEKFYEQRGKQISLSLNKNIWCVIEKIGRLLNVPFIQSTIGIMLYNIFDSMLTA